MCVLKKSAQFVLDLCTFCFRDYIYDRFKKLNKEIKEIEELEKE